MQPLYLAFQGTDLFLSFATLSAYRAGIDITTVDEMLNHTNASLKLARVYIERDFSVLWRANRKMIEMFNWDAVR